MSRSAVRSPRRRAAAIAGLALVAAGVGAIAVFVLAPGGNALRAPDAVDPPKVPVPAESSLPAASAAGTSAVVEGNETIAGARASAQEGRDVEVHVIDDAYQPVAGATVRLRAPGSWQLPAAVEWAPTAVTDANGRAVLHDVREGQWFATAEHDGLVQHSSLQQALQWSLLALGDTATTVRLVEPYVTGIRVRGGELLHHQFDWSAVFERVEGARSMQPVLQRLEQRWPGARFAFWVRSPEPEYGATGNRCGALVIVNGRERWTGTVEPARLGEFQGPLELDAAQLTRSDNFGTLVLRALDVGGDVTKGLAVNLGPGSGCDLRLNRRIENGDELTLPTGSYYSLRCDEPFLQQLLMEGVRVARGTRRVIDFGGRPLTRCELELLGPPTTTWVRLDHAALREPVDHRVHGRGTLACWLPEGTVTATFFAHEGGANGPLGFAEQVSSVEVGRSAPVAVGGGTWAAPQHVVLSPVARH